MLQDDYGEVIMRTTTSLYGEKGERATYDTNKTNPHNTDLR